MKRIKFPPPYQHPPLKVPTYDTNNPGAQAAYERLGEIDMVVSSKAWRRLALAPMTLDVTTCAFECGRNATGVREYRRDARTAVWLGACDDCDERARLDLARAENRFNRQLTTPLAEDVENEHDNHLRAQRNWQAARAATETPKQRETRLCRERVRGKQRRKVERCRTRTATNAT